MQNTWTIEWAACYYRLLFLGLNLRCVRVHIGIQSQISFQLHASSYNVDDVVDKYCIPDTHTSATVNHARRYLRRCAPIQHSQVRAILRPNQLISKACAMFQIRQLLCQYPHQHRALKGLQNQNRMGSTFNGIVFSLPHECINYGSMVAEMLGEVVSIMVFGLKLCSP